MTEHYLGRVRVILYTFQKHSIVSQYNHTSRELLAELKDKREQKQGVSNSYKKEERGRRARREKEADNQERNNRHTLVSIVSALFSSVSIFATTSGSDCKSSSFNSISQYLCTNFLINLLPSPHPHYRALSPLPSFSPLNSSLHAPIHHTFIHILALFECFFTACSLAWISSAPPSCASAMFNLSFSKQNTKNLTSICIFADLQCKVRTISTRERLNERGLRSDSFQDEGKQGKVVVLVKQVDSVASSQVCVLREQINSKCECIYHLCRECEQPFVSSSPPFNSSPLCQPPPSCLSPFYLIFINDISLPNTTRTDLSLEPACDGVQR